jgi:hypothetical protein
MCCPKNYIALTWPNERVKHSGAFSWKAGRAFREMDRFVKRRGPIPSEFWGGDPRRCEVAQKVSSIIKGTIGWTTDNFLPDDPVDILLWGGWYDLAEVEAIMEIEKQFVLDIPKDEIEKIFGGLTLGELVDYLLENAACIATWPLQGEGSLESRACPKLAAFVDLREFVQRHCHAECTKLRPSTDLRSAVRRCDWLRLDRFLRSRFDVSGLVRRRFFGMLSPWWAWLMSSALAAVAIGKVLRWEPNGWLLGALLALVVLGILVARLSRPTWRRGPSTAREVVEWILERRSHTANTVQL